jgi:PrcB C-terminal
MQAAQTCVRVTITLLCLAGAMGVPAAGASRMAVFQPSTGDWLLPGERGVSTVVSFGRAEDQPVAADYLGAGAAQMALFRPSTREWRVRNDDGTATVVPFGGPGDQPVAADYLGLGRRQIAVFRPATAEWFIRTDAGDTVRVQWGAPGDRPVPADYLGLGRAQIAVFRPSTQEWFLRDDQGTATRVPFGGPGDEPVPADYLGLDRAQLAVFRPTTAELFQRTDEGGTRASHLGEPNGISVAAAFAPEFGLWEGDARGVDLPGESVIRTPEAWQRLWDQVHAASISPAPVIDFEQQMVVAVFADRQPTGGYSRSVEAVEFGDAEIRVTVRAHAPGAGALVPQQVTQPYQMLVVKRSALPVRFIDAAP